MKETKADSIKEHLTGSGTIYPDVKKSQEHEGMFNKASKDELVKRMGFDLRKGGNE